MNQILLKLDSEGNVMAQYVGPHAQQVKELFETDTIPTGFYVLGMPMGNIGAWRKEVREEVEHSNPGVSVAWAIAWRSHQ